MLPAFASSANEIVHVKASGNGLITWCDSLTASWLTLYLQQLRSGQRYPCTPDTVCLQDVLLGQYTSSSGTFPLAVVTCEHTQQGRYSNRAPFVTVKPGWSSHVSQLGKAFVFCLEEERGLSFQGLRIAFEEWSLLILVAPREVPWQQVDDFWNEVAQLNPAMF